MTPMNKTLNNTFNVPLFFAGALAIAGTYAAFGMHESAVLLRTKAHLFDQAAMAALLSYVYGIAGGCGFITFVAMLRKSF